jgi:hypothetical protein
VHSAACVNRTTLMTPIRVTQSAFGACVNRTTLMTPVRVTQSAFGSPCLSYDVNDADQGYTKCVRQSIVNRTTVMTSIRVTQSVFDSLF